MSALGRSLVVVVVIAIAGSIVLRGAGSQGEGDPTASILNGGPRGLLLLGLWWQQRGLHVQRRATFDESLAAADAIVVAAPEQSVWLEAETAEILQAVSRGARLIVLCDDDDVRSRRLDALLLPVGTQCRIRTLDDDDARPAPDTDEGIAAHDVLGVQDGAPVVVRGRGRVELLEQVGLVPTWTVGSDPVVVQTRHGDGVVVVIGSGSVGANDGVRLGGNAALWRAALGDASRIVVDERHHQSRARAAVLAAAMRGPGPWTALIALALLVPTALLSLSPRRGAAALLDDAPVVPAARARVRALAALHAHAMRARLFLVPRRRRSPP